MLQIAPGMTIDAAENLGVVRFLNLVDGRQRLMAMVNAEVGKQRNAVPSAGPEIRPDGSKVIRFQGNDGLRSLMKMMQAEQKKAGRT